MRTLLTTEVTVEFLQPRLAFAFQVALEFEDEIAIEEINKPPGAEGMNVLFELDLPELQLRKRRRQKRREKMPQLIVTLLASTGISDGTDVIGEGRVKEVSQVATG